MSIPESFLVIVKCMTFNHHAYIEDAMSGFCMQETVFPYLCIVMDDYSTDGEQEVIKNYVAKHFNLITDEETDDYVLNFCQHKTNDNCYFAVFYLKYNHYSIGKKSKKTIYYSKWQDKCKYVALCEGDDYWIDEKKLQIQVDFLEKNEGYSMVFHSAEIKNELGTQCPLKCDEIQDREYSPTEVFENWIVPTASIMHRKTVTDVKNKDKYKPLNGDIVLILNCAKIGKLRGINKKMSVYRVQQNGVTYDSSLKEYRALRYPDHFKYIKDNFPFVKRRIINAKIASSYLGCISYTNGKIKKIGLLITAFFISPFGTVGKIVEYIKKKI